MYEHPANSQAVDTEDPWQSDPEWLKALPVGNSFLGAMLFGNVNYERIQLNEKSCDREALTIIIIRMPRRH